MDHCLEDLSHNQGDPHYEEVSAHDPGGVNGTGSPSHDAGFNVLSSLTSRKTSLKSELKFTKKNKTIKTTKDSEGEV